MSTEQPTGGRDRTLTAVVCATYTQFRSWCIDNDRSPRDPSLRMVLEESHARGCWFDRVVEVEQREPDLFAIARTRLRPSGGGAVSGWDPEDIANSYRPCSQCGSSGHAGDVCPYVPGDHGTPVSDYSDGLEQLRQASDRIAAEQREEALVPDAVAEVTADTGRLTEALRRIGESCAGLANFVVGYERALLRSASGALPQLSQIEQDQREALGRACGGLRCFHPHQNIRVDPDTTTVSCPDCPAEITGPHGSGPVLEPYAIPAIPSSDYSVGRWAAQHAVPVPQDSPGLGSVGRNVPEHRPGSWLSGRPWDDQPSPARDVLPERKPDTTPEQRLREAADRIRGGWI